MSLFNQTNVTNFVLEVADNGLTEAFKLNVQSGPVGAIRIPVSDTPGSTQGMHRSQLPGSTTEFDPLMIRFLVDENMDSWLSMYRWLTSINNYIDRDKTGWKDRITPLRTVTMHILNNTKDEIIMSIHYHGAWVSDLNEIEYNFTEDTDILMVCTAIIPYKYFEVEKDGIIISGQKSMADMADQKAVRAGLHPSMR